MLLNERKFAARSSTGPWSLKGLLLLVFLAVQLSCGFRKEQRLVKWER